MQALVDAAVPATTSPALLHAEGKLVGLDRLTFYDRFAPIGDDPTRVSWDEAKDIVLRVHDFAPEAGDIAERFFHESWIDAPTRENKRTGAFCATSVPGVHPYILMNFTGDRRSILTLAHELGHGLHGSLAEPLGLFNADTPLTTAETASVFGEALTFKRLLALEDDPHRRLNLLAGRIEDSIATVFRQIAMNRFEDAVHTERRDEGEVSPDRFEELWLDTQKTMFEDSVDIDGYGTWWSYIPHFLSTPGYVYAYAYGFLFALAIFRRYEQEGESMVEPYLDVLRAGGSKPPEELAEIVGLDLTDPGIWASGIDALAVELDEAEALAKEIGEGLETSSEPKTSFNRSVGAFRRYPPRLTGRSSEGKKEEVCAKAHRVRGRPRSGPRAYGARCARRGGADTRRHSQDDRHRRDVPAHRPGGAVRADPARDEDVLQLHQRPEREGPDRQARDHGPAGQLEVLRRRLQPREHGSADEEARRGGQGLRDRRSARDRARSRGAGVSEPGEGAADARLDRCVVLGSPVQGVPLDDRLAAGLHRRGPALRHAHQGELHSGKKIAVVYQNDDYGKDYLYGLRAALGKSYADANIVAREAVEVDRHDRRVADGQDQGQRRDDLGDLPLRRRRCGRSRRARHSATTRSRST